MSSGLMSDARFVIGAPESTPAFCPGRVALLTGTPSTMIVGWLAAAPKVFAPRICIAVEAVGSPLIWCVTMPGTLPAIA